MGAPASTWKHATGFTPLAKHTRAEGGRYFFAPYLCPVERAAFLAHARYLQRGGVDLYGVLEATVPVFNLDDALAWQWAISELLAKVFVGLDIRPVPPAGMMPLARPSSGAPCPGCGEPFAHASGGGGIQGAPEEVWEAARHVVGALNTSVMHQGFPILRHPLRFGLGQTMCCGADTWNDFGGLDRTAWRYFYTPTRGQLGLWSGPNTANI